LTVSCYLVRSLFALVLGALPALDTAFVPAFAQDSKVMPREQTIHRTATAGAELRVFGYAAWNRSCQANPVPGVEILTPPAHGKIELRPGQATVAFIRKGEADCTGKVFPAEEVWYTPEAGYRGADKFDLHVINRTYASHDTYVIDVN
jgi:hypothetical protein